MIVDLKGAQRRSYNDQEIEQVLSKNGEKLEGSPIIKDTLNVKYGETCEVAFVADNPGNWLFHCHDLYHASSGMVTTVKYNNFKGFYTIQVKLTTSQNKIKKYFRFFGDILYFFLQSKSFFHSRVVSFHNY
jgi:hypothetical protein